MELENLTKMKNQSKITIAGLPGSGKGTLIQKLSENYQLEHQSIGSMRRLFAKEKNLTIDELNLLRKTDQNVDTQFDQYQKKFMEENSDWIMEGRLSYFFAPNDAIKLFLSVDPLESAKRIYNANRDSEKTYKSIEETLKTIKSRTNSDKETYWNLYKTNCYDVTNFDIILDTTKKTEEEVFKETIKRIDSLTSI